jgi:thiol-disulfide isomerase/thioredoxin
MQDRVTDSLGKLSRSSTKTTVSERNRGKSDLDPRSKDRNLLGQLLGLAFWGIVGVATCCWFAITSSAAQTNDQNNILLDFSAKWCGPCQQMSPLVSKLERQGLPIRKVDVDVEKELASRFNVTGIPCFVLVANGREVERITGATDEKTLRAMMMKLPRPGDNDSLIAKNVSTSSKNNDTKLIPTDSNGTFRGQNSNQDASSDPMARKPLGSSARIKITTEKDIRYGSGTIIDSEPGRAIILTCGHILRGHKKNSLIEVDYYPAGKNKPQTFVGQIIGFDAEADIGLLDIASNQLLPVAKIGIGTKPLSVKDRVLSVGCGGGECPTPKNHAITGLNRYKGPDTIECSGIPEQGRSGGGLFLDSELVGVCILADPKDKRGIYTGLKPVVQLLKKWDLGHLVPSLNPVDELLAEVDLAKGNGDVESAVAMTDDLSLRHGEESAEELQEASQNSEIAKFDPADYVGAEIFCIVQPKTPGAPRRIVVVNQATPKFVDDLLRDSTNSVRSDAKSPVRAIPRTVPASRTKAPDVTRSTKGKSSKKPIDEAVTFDDDDGPVETAFAPQRSRGSRN